MKISFRQYFESCTSCNVVENELEPGDDSENINPECDHFRSAGKVVKVVTVPQDKDRDAGRIIVYRVSNSNKDFPEGETNGEFNIGDLLKKTEIQLKKI